MKILIVTPHYYPEPFSVTIIAEELAKKGHHVAVVTGHPYIAVNNDTLEKYRTIKYEVINDVEVYRIKHRYKKDSLFSIYRCYLSFWHSCKSFLSYFEEDFDIIFSFCISPIISCSGANLYSKYHNVKHIHFCYDIWPESAVSTGHIKRNSLKYLILKKWSKLIYNGCSHIFVTSPSFIKYLRDTFDLRNIPITTVHQPINFIEPSDKSNFDPKKFHILYAGNVSELQLVDKLVMSAKNLDPSKFTIHIIGTGSYYKKMVDFVKENKMENIIDICGPKPGEILAGYYEECDALYLGLKMNSFVGNTIPYKLIQYLNAGKPIIASISGDGKMILEEAGGALVIKDTPEDIAKAIITVSNLSNSEKKKMAKNNKEYCSNNFDKKIIINQIENLLEKDIQ